jgi:hypothetical protein
MTKEELDKHLAAHSEWLGDISTGKRADLRAANLNDTKLRGVHDVIDLGQPNGWPAHAYKWDDSIWANVGCRTKSLADGRAYWAGKDDRREVLAALDYAEIVARLRWVELPPIGEAICNVVLTSDRGGRRLQSRLATRAGRPIGA